MDRLSLPDCAVNAVARKLVAHGCWLVGDGFRGPPPETDLAFWREVASVAHASIALSAAPSQLFSALTLAAACRDELEVCDTSEIRPGTLYLSDIVSARSKLSCAILGIQGVLIVSAVPVAFDVATHVIDPSASLTDQLPAAITFARNLGGAALVCSHGANGMGAVVCAAVLAATEGLSSSVALAQVGMRRGLPLPVERDHEEGARPPPLTAPCHRPSGRPGSRDDVRMRDVDVGALLDVVRRALRVLRCLSARGVPVAPWRGLARPHAQGRRHDEAFEGGGVEIAGQTAGFAAAHVDAKGQEEVGGACWATAIRFRRLEPRPWGRSGLARRARRRRVIATTFACEATPRPRPSSIRGEGSSETAERRAGDESCVVAGRRVGESIGDGSRL